MLSQKSPGDVWQVILVSEHNHNVTGMENQFGLRIELDGTSDATNSDHQETVIAADFDFAHGLVGEIGTWKDLQFVELKSDLAEIFQE